jgi:hypothetical protein
LEKSVTAKNPLRYRNVATANRLEDTSCRTHKDIGHHATLSAA